MCVRLLGWVLATHWYLEQVELAKDGWRVTGGLCWADIRKPTANRLKLRQVPVEGKAHIL